MKTVLFTITFLIIGSATTLSAQNQENYYKSDFMLARNQIEIGLFAPMRIATSESIEWQTHPILFLQAPNLAVTIRQKRALGWNWASRHGFFSPTYLLRRVAHEGTGGFISPEFSIPQMVALKNAIIASRNLFHKGRITLDAGFQFAVKSGTLDRRTSIDLPFIYPRLAVFYSGYQFTLGAQLDKRLSERWAFQFSLNGFFAEDLALESAGWLAWNTRKQTQIRLGYFLSFARYPFGTQAHLFVPLIDIVWHFTMKR